MISPQQLAQRRDQGTRMIETAFRTTIKIGATDNIPAARWSSNAAVIGELAGLLPTADRTYRVRRDVLVGITITPERTVIEEDGKRFRVERIGDAAGDPAIVIQCKAV